MKSTIRFSRTANVNTSPVIRARIRRPSTVFSAIARFTHWEENAAAASATMKRDSRIARIAVFRTGRTIMKR